MVRPERRWAATLSALTLALVLAVIAASAYVRLGSTRAPLGSTVSIEGARAIRESAGGAAAFGVLVLAGTTVAVRETRVLAPVAGAALALTILLSLVGFATGIRPPPVAAFVNQFGGVLLAGTLGWVSGRAAVRCAASAPEQALATVALVSCVLQAAFGGAIATVTPDPPLVLLVLHAACGLAAASCAGAVVLACAHLGAGVAGALLGGCAGVVLLLGLASAVFAPSAVLQVAHAVAGAMLLASAAHARARFAAGA